MTSRLESDRTGRCPLCGGILEEGVAPVPVFLDERVIIIKDVPAEVCVDCDEAYLKSMVVENLERLLDKLEEMDSEFSVVHYKIA